MYIYLFFPLKSKRFYEKPSCDVKSFTRKRNITTFNLVYRQDNNNKKGKKEGEKKAAAPLTSPYRVEAEKVEFVLGGIEYLSHAPDHDAHQDRRSRLGEVVETIPLDEIGTQDAQPQNYHLKSSRGCTEVNVSQKQQRRSTIILTLILLVYKGNYSIYTVEYGGRVVTPRFWHYTLHLDGSSNFTPASDDRARSWS